MKLPFPCGAQRSAHRSTDRRGYYVGSVNRTSGVGFSFRLFDPYYGNAVGDNAESGGAAGAAGPAGPAECGPCVFLHRRRCHGPGPGPDHRPELRQRV